MPVLAIIGFHRSGTSMLGKILHEGGISMGSHLLGMSFSNPHGHFEDTQVIDLNAAILRHQGGDWATDHAVTSFVDPQDVVAIQSYVEHRRIETRQFGIKDPRLMSTIRTWHLAVPSLKMVYIHRGFERCCKSLWMRAYKDLRFGRAPEVNQMILSSKQSVIELYLNNVATFFEAWANRPGARAQTAFIDYDALVAGQVDLSSVLTRLGFDASAVDPAPHIDKAAIHSLEGFKGQIDPAVLKQAHAVDSEIARLCVTR